MSRPIADDIATIAKIEAVQKILEVICRSTGLGFSAVARVTESHWTACAVRDEIAFGLAPGGELPLETTICHEIRQSGRLVVIDHVAEDPSFCTHHTPQTYGFQSYISVPILLADGEFFGTLCGIDPKPHRLNTPETIGMFKLFAELIAAHLDSQRRMEANITALQREQQNTLQREQFIAVLGHDLRNPLSAIRSAADLLRVLPPGDRSKEVVGIIKRSAARMGGLIDNVLDFARGRLGGGLTVRRRPETDLQGMIDQVISELQANWPQREIRRVVACPTMISCDRSYMGQLLSNLLSNALIHGEPDTPVVVEAACTQGAFRLSVTNRGAPIPEAVRQRLFEPFTRGSLTPGKQGLGLGLYIVAEIARAHGGSIDVACSDGNVQFSLTMPLVNDEMPPANHVS